MNKIDIKNLAIDIPMARELIKRKQEEILRAAEEEKRQKRLALKQEEKEKNTKNNQTNGYYDENPYDFDVPKAKNENESSNADLAADGLATGAGGNSAQANPTQAGQAGTNNSNTGQASAVQTGGPNVKLNNFIGGNAEGVGFHD